MTQLESMWATREFRCNGNALGTQRNLFCFVRSKLGRRTEERKFMKSLIDSEQTLHWISPIVSSLGGNGARRASAHTPLVKFYLAIFSAGDDFRRLRFKLGGWAGDRREKLRALRERCESMHSLFNCSASRDGRKNEWKTERNNWTKQMKKTELRPNRNLLDVLVWSVSFIILHLIAFFVVLFK